MRFCPVCSYYLYLQTVVDEEVSALFLTCRHCGFREEMAPKTAEEALLLETRLVADQTKSTSVLNEFTKLDPTLPHLKTIACPNPACPTQANPDTRDVLYVKTDTKNLKYQYCCRVCDTQWST